MGVAGGATNAQLINDGAQVAFTNIFGNAFGNILNLCIAISCFGTLNGLMLGLSRGMYSMAARGRGPAPKVFGKVDENVDMPANSCVMAMVLAAAWMAYFYFANLWSFPVGEETVSLAGKPFAFDCTELPIITVYMMYLPIFIQWMRKEKDQNLVRRFIVPGLAMFGSAFMVLACILSHKMACFWYMIVFAVIMFAGYLIQKRNQKNA